MSKIALVYSFQESNWFSCVKIVGNLLKSYKLLKDTEIIPVNYNQKIISTSLRSLANDIKKTKADKIVFLDHKPHPLQALKEILKVDPKFDKEIIFHLYGDFTLYFAEWMQLNSLLIGRRVKFICASDKQVNLVKKFIDTTEAFVEKVPFPVDKNEFYYDKSSKDIRSLNNLPADSKVLLYTGRLSLQKNIVELVEIFLKALKSKKISENTYLLLAGEFDSLGFPFADTYHHLGEYYRSFDQAINDYPNNLKEKIKLLGKIENSKLKDYYNTTNMFVSFSTYHDEDYGMSVAEAGACGLPILLTDWAGFSSFNLSKQCANVKTSLKQKRPEFDKEEAYEKLIHFCNSKDFSRNEQQEKFTNYLSVEAVSKRLEGLLKTQPAEFEGFNSFLFKLGRVNKFNSQVFLNAPDKILNKSYFEVYDVYASEN